VVVVKVVYFRSHVVAIVVVYRDYFSYFFLLQAVLWLIV